MRRRRGGHDRQFRFARFGFAPGRIDSEGKCWTRVRSGFVLTGNVSSWKEQKKLLILLAVLLPPPHRHRPPPPGEKETG